MAMAQDNDHCRSILQVCMMQLQTIALYHLILMYGQAEDVNLPM